MSNEIIELFTPEGETKEYRKFSSRLPDFLKAYPKDKGYRVSVEISDPLAHKPGLMKLYEQAIAQGKTPQEMGLPPMPAGDVMVFTATLHDGDGNTLECASALRLIQNYKDWEKGETAARQRLISALGFGGDCFDADEASDMGDQGLRVKAKGQGPAQVRQIQPRDNQSETDQAEEGAAASGTGATSRSEVESDTGTPTVDQVETVLAPTADQQESQLAGTLDESASPTETSVEPASSATSEPVGDSPKEVIPDRILRQIAHQSKIKNTEPKEFSTIKEAKAELKRLMSL